MSKIFETTKISSMALRNRLVRSATWEGMCDPDGRPTQKLADCYRALARGGAGLIITGYAFVLPDGRQSPCMIGIHTDAFASDMKMVVDAVHTEGGAICMQLVHTGGQTTSKIIGRRPLAPSAIKVDQFFDTPAEMTKRDIDEVVAAFGAAAKRAKEYGFDAVQLHAAHGYLINEFLSPLTNRRTDEYGGSIENRCRFLRDVYQRVRSAAGRDFPVMVKLNGSDNLDNGLALEDAVYAAKTLDNEGVDAIEVSGGTPASGALGPVRVKIDRPEQEAYNLPLATEIKKAVKCPVMVVGGFRSYDIAEGVVRRRDADYISLARPFIREPDLPRRWQSGDHAKATCISCNGCFKAGIRGGIYCVQDEKEKKGKGV
jgi:2,4-dienoyl-CoA reductase-like NADH-dependent reductase (Old Yellow Enzyme family)